MRDEPSTKRFAESVLEQADDHGMEFGEIGPTASALFAAVAAGASAYSARHNARIWRAGLRPDLKLAFRTSQQGFLQLAVKNAGPGTAKTIQFMIVWENQKVGGLIPLAAFLRSDTGLTVTTRIVAPPKHEVDPRAVVICRGADGEVHAWDHDDRHKTFSSAYERRHQSPKPAYRETVFREFFPDVDVSGMPLGAGSWRAGLDASADPSSGPIPAD